MYVAIIVCNEEKVVDSRQLIKTFMAAHYRSTYVIHRIWENVRGGNFRGFSLQRESFPANYGLSINNINLQKYYSENFTANSYFPLKVQKFPAADVFPRVR